MFIKKQIMHKPIRYILYYLYICTKKVCQSRLSKLQDMGVSTLKVVSSKHGDR